MDEDLTDDQRVLLDATTRFVEEVCPLSSVRDRAHDDPAHRRHAGELGWFSLLVPDHLGGGSVSGNGVLDAALVAYRRGRGLAPGPFVGTNIVAHTLAVAGDEEQQAKLLPALMAGEVSAAWAVAAPHDAVALGGVARVTGVRGGHQLDGHATFVEDPGPDGWLLVTAGTDAGPAQFLVPLDAPGLRTEALASLDLSRRFVEITLDGVRLPASALVGAPGHAASLVDRQLALACVLTAAGSAGAMDHEFELTVQYAKDRIAFGRPIGSFQAIKHALADTALNLEMSKAIVLAAAQHLGGDGGADGDGLGLEAASMAKAFVGDCGIDLAQQCFQVFGGIGFTWEHDQHLFLRRLTTDAALFGSPAWHRERLCQLGGM